MKCYGIDIPNHAKYFGFEMKRTIFPGGIRPKLFGLGILFHYPNQFFRSFNNIRYDWPTQIQSRNQVLEMTIKMNTFEVTRRRNSRWNQCSANWKKYDFDIVKSYVEKLGCRPVYDNWGSSYQTCNSSEQMANWENLISNRPQIMEPCQSADKIVYRQFDQYFDNQYFNFASNDSFFLYIDMRMSRVKVTEHKQAYNFQNLIGNSGGYIGLFLGNTFII
jgi:hypothetical protein